MYTRWTSNYALSLSLTIRPIVDINSKKKESTSLKHLTKLSLNFRFCLHSTFYFQKIKQFNAYFLWSLHGNVRLTIIIHFTHNVSVLASTCFYVPCPSCIIYLTWLFHYDSLSLSLFLYLPLTLLPSNSLSHLLTYF